jgi:hypothetical protein
MTGRKKRDVVRKTTFEEEQRMKDEAFLKLSPSERLRIHEQLRKKIWGEQYNSVSIKGMRVVKKPVQQ